MCFTLAIVGGQKKWQKEVWQRSCEGDAVLVRTHTPLSLLLCDYACFIILFGFISVSLSQSRHEAYSCKLEHGDMSCVSTLFFKLCVGCVLEAVGSGSLLLSRHVSLQRCLR